MASTKIDGMWRLIHMDANDIPLSVILEKHSSEFLGTTGTPETDAQKLPKFKRHESPILNEDEKLVIAFRPDADAAQASTGAAFVRAYRIPVTYNNLRSGHTFEKTLIDSDFSVIEAPTNSKTLVAGQWVYLSEYTLPAQSQMVLGHGLQDVRVDSAIRMQLDVNLA